MPQVTELVQFASAVVIYLVITTLKLLDQLWEWEAAQKGGCMHAAAVMQLPREVQLRGYWRTRTCGSLSSDNCSVVSKSVRCHLQALQRLDWLTTAFLCWIAMVWVHTGSCREELPSNSKEDKNSENTWDGTFLLPSLTSLVYLWSWCESASLQKIESGEKLCDLDSLFCCSLFGSLSLTLGKPWAITAGVNCSAKTLCEPWVAGSWSGAADQSFRAGLVPGGCCAALSACGWGLCCRWHSWSSDSSHAPALARPVFTDLRRSFGTECVSERWGCSSPVLAWSEAATSAVHAATGHGHLLSTLRRGCFACRTVSVLKMFLYSFALLNFFSSANSIVAKMWAFKNNAGHSLIGCVGEQRSVLWETGWGDEGLPEKWQRPGLPRPSALEGCCSTPVHAWTPSARLPGELGALPHGLYLHTARAGNVFNSLIGICILHVASASCWDDAGLSYPPAVPKWLLP